MAHPPFPHGSTFSASGTRHQDWHDAEVVFFFCCGPAGLFRPDVVHQTFFVIGSPGSAGPQKKKKKKTNTTRALPKSPQPTVSE